MMNLFDKVLDFFQRPRCDEIDSLLAIKFGSDIQKLEYWENVPDELVISIVRRLSMRIWTMSSVDAGRMFLYVYCRYQKDDKVVYDKSMRKIIREEYIRWTMKNCG